jgi:hypothetical protein
VSATLKATTNVKMIEVFMLVGLLITFNDVLMQCYLHCHGQLGDEERFGSQALVLHVAPI